MWLRILSTVFIGVVASLTSYADDALPIANTKCPVMTGSDASDDYAVEYRGANVRFCCSECRKEFQQNPEKYESVLTIPETSAFEDATTFCQEHSTALLCGTLALVLVVLRLLRVGKPAKVMAEKRWYQSGTAATVFATAVLILGVIGFRILDARYDAEIEESIHFETFAEFGNPPKPKHPGVEATTSATFYRGNDERNEKLFNNGNYRTATFHVSLCTADGNKVSPGKAVAGERLFVKLEIERPPFTPDFLYQEDMMNKMFVTQQHGPFLGRDEPVSDRINLTTVEPAQRWEALVPVELASDGGSEIAGVVYVCEECDFQTWWMPWEHRVRGGSRFHYGIQYVVNLDHGRVAEGSDIWMGALYRTRKFSIATVPLREWFSHIPIPVLTSAQSTSDPELLGIADYK